MKKSGAVRTVAIMIAATIFSKLLGVVRQIIFAKHLGDGIYAVAFAAASKVSLSIFDILFSAAILGCFIPFYNGKRLLGEKDAGEFSSAFFTFAVLVTGAASVLGVIFSRRIIFVFAPNLSAEALGLASNLLKIMFPMMIFTAGAFVLVGVLQSHDSFIVPALMSAVSNIFITIALVTVKNIASERGISLLAASYVVGWALQLLTLAIPLARHRLMPKFSIKFKSAGVFSSLGMSPGVIVGAWLLPASSLAANFLSSFVSDSAVAAFDYSLSVWVIASGVLTYGVCNFVFPRLSSIDGNTPDFASEARKSVGAALLLSLPVSAGLALLSENVISLLYLRGSFSPELAVSCGKILAALSLSTPAYCVTEVLCRVFFARKTSKIPMISSLCGIGAFLSCGAVSTFVFSGGAVGIALSYSAGQLASALVLVAFAAINIDGFLKKSDAKSIVFGAVSAAASYAAMRFLSLLISKNPSSLPFSENFIVTALVFLLGCVVYLICIYFSRLLPIGHKHAKK